MVLAFLYPTISHIYNHIFYVRFAALLEVVYGISSSGYTTTFHEFHLLVGCKFGFCGIMEEGGIVLISDLEASFGWIPVTARGCGSLLAGLGWHKPYGKIGMAGSHGARLAQL
ncbi:hypothetical protein DVH24_003269 [Malus domestica]|uniref:Uncharacterized protein n=1 Tax=Malus domestica TaxID=3750 RepID=A0A498IMS1_MALDO|nr:hypothetical protein DVH24_003269 [Malus domestica]